MNEKNSSCTKQIEQTFTTNPLAAQWFIQKEKAISESLDNMHADWGIKHAQKEAKKLGKIERKLTSDQISEFSKLYEKVHDMNGENSLLPKKIEQKIKDESKFDQNNDPIVKEAQKLFTDNPKNAKWYFQVSELEKLYQTTIDHDYNDPNSKYGKDSKFTKETINQIFQLSKQQDVEKTIDKSPEREINRHAYLIDKDRLHTKNDKKVLAKKAMLTKRQLER